MIHRLSVYVFFVEKKSLGNHKKKMQSRPPRLTGTYVLLWIATSDDNFSVFSSRSISKSHKREILSDSNRCPRHRFNILERSLAREMTFLGGFPSHVFSTMGQFEILNSARLRPS